MIWWCVGVGTNSLPNSVMNTQLRQPIMCRQPKFTLSFWIIKHLIHFGNRKTRSLKWCCNLLGTRLIALRGRSTLTVLMAVKLTFCRSSEYSIILEKTHKTYKKKRVNNTNTSRCLQSIRGIKENENQDQRKATITRVIITEEQFYLNFRVVLI